MPQPPSSSTALIHKASLNARRGHWQSNERPIILFDWQRRRTSAPISEHEIKVGLSSYRIRLVIGPGEAEPFDRCTSRVTAADTIRRGRALYLRASKAHASHQVRRNPTIGNRQPANQPPITHLRFYTASVGSRHPGYLRFPEVTRPRPIAHIAAPAPCRPKLAPVTRCVPQ